MKIKIVSTFSDAGYEEYGRNFIESCRQYLSKDITLTLYVDNVKIVPDSNMEILSYDSYIPEMKFFKERHKDKPVHSFIYDGVKFAYKSYAMCHASKQNDCDILIWLDADTVLQSYIDSKYLLQFLKPNKFAGYIGRKGAPETGFIIFDLSNPNANIFFDTFKRYYDTDEVYQLSEYHDAFVFKHLIDKFESEKLLEGINLIEGQKVKHPLNFLFDSNIIHYKGEHKSKDAIHAHQEYKKRNKIGKYANGKS